MSVSSPFLMPSLQVGRTDVVVVLLVDVVVVLEVVVLELVLVVVLLLVLVVLLELLELVLVVVLLLVELVEEVELVVELLDVEVLLLVVLVLVVVLVATVVLVVVGGGGQALPAPLRHTSLAPVPAAISLYAQVLCGKFVQWRWVSAPFVTVYTVFTPPAGGAPPAKMPIGVSPRLLPTILSKRPGLITPTLASVGPPVGASLLMYLATVLLFAFQPSLPLLTPAGSTNAPATLPPA
jgi:hypothetical protein